MKIKLLATGFITLTLFCVLLFWPRWMLDNRLNEMMYSQQGLYIDFNGRVLSDNFTVPLIKPFQEFGIVAKRERIPFKPGLKLDSVMSRYRYPNHQVGAPQGFLYLGGNSGGKWLYFDEHLGLFIDSQFSEVMVDGKTQWIKTVFCYVGPNGVSPQPDPKLGRFIKPLLSMTANFDTVVYDEGSSRFSSIVYDQRKIKAVKTSLPLPKDSPHKPIAIEYFRKNDFLNLNIKDAYTTTTVTTSQPALPGMMMPGGPGMAGPGMMPSPPGMPQQNVTQTISKKIDPLHWWLRSDQILVLDQTGRIDRFDLNTMQFAGEAGYIPDPKSLLAYSVLPFRVDDKWHGVAVATIDRWNEMALDIFDEKGKWVPGGAAVLTPKVNPWTMAWGSSIMIGKYLLECLHPPILSAASIPAARYIDPANSLSSLFFLPNSFMATLKIETDTYNSKGEDVGNYAGKLFFMLLPPVILGILLALVVDGEASALGLNKRTKQFWFYATIAFGLVGFIIWRLVRPGGVMVTCQSCGKLRRPELENCQRCGSAWVVPELAPPVWRVVSAAESEQAEKVDITEKASVST